MVELALHLSTVTAVLVVVVLVLAGVWLVRHL